MSNITKEHSEKKDQEKSIRTLWDERYATEGHIWGDEPSATAQELMDRLETASKVLEVGFGYGRDVIELVKHGHMVTGVEESSVGLNEAVATLKRMNKLGEVHLTLGEYTKAALAANTFDAVVSHRMLHLLGDNGLVRAFVSTTSKILKPGGLLYISARNEEDYNPQQMKKIGPYAARYTLPEREGHLVTFWNEARFRDLFEKKFEILSFSKGEEIESRNNNVPAHFTIMKARKRPDNNNGAPAQHLS